ncbi:DUF4381 domain-containing protein [Achromobacter aloeverae]|uniref:DUF4381 domain-containing protein n=1 Tax=Achromobacter aloeverae TaxID=1750518 RepID=A0A4Q1HN15_9BURK|nr:DUF4381 domain-containing protein [Achromobacter aloeverae]RXN92384.1 DUF4381 domain-containing protein [Achromobacter aloeverae]
MSTDLPGLDQLRELPLPAPVSYWPQTWGWAVVAVVICALAAYGLLATVRTRRRNLYRRQALAELARIRKEAELRPLAARQLPDLLKRTALAAAAIHAERAGRHKQAGWQGRHHGSPPPDVPAVGVAALSGQAWMAYLAQDMGPGTMLERGRGTAGRDADRGPPVAAPLSVDSVRLLPILAYAPDATVRDIDPAALGRLFDDSLRWMERHHVAA